MRFRTTSRAGDFDCYRAEQAAYPWHDRVTCDVPTAKAIIHWCYQQAGVAEESEPTLTVRRVRHRGGGWYRVGDNRIHMRASYTPIPLMYAHGVIHEACHGLSHRLQLYDRHGPKFRAIMQVMANKYAREHGLETGSIRGADVVTLDWLDSRINGVVQSEWNQCPTCGFTVRRDQIRQHCETWGCEWND